MAACRKNTAVNTPAATSLYQITLKDPTNFSFLKTAINRAGLAAKLSADGQYTLFAPTNAAFKSAGFADTLAVLKADSATLAQILLYHLVQQDQPLSTLPTGTTVWKALSGQNLTLSRTAAGLWTINGANVTSKDHAATNGSLQVVNRLLAPPVTDLLTLVKNNANLSFLAAAIVKASQGGTDFNALLTGTNPLTFFAPSNAAFTAAGYSTAAAVTAVDAPTLTTWLNYELSQGQQLSPNLPDSGSISSLSDKPLYTNQPSLGNTLANGSLVSGANANNLASNGVLHITGKLLIQPVQTLVQAIAANSSLTFLNAAITRASQSGTNFTQLLAGTDAYTIFAPTDAAFKTAGYASIAAVNAADPAALAALIKNQLLAGRRFSLLYTEGATAQSLAGSTLTFSAVSGFKVKGVSNTTFSNLSAIDLLTINGVMHVSDQVLKP